MSKRHNEHLSLSDALKEFVDTNKLQDGVRNGLHEVKNNLGQGYTIGLSTGAEKAATTVVQTGVDKGLDAIESGVEKAKDQKENRKEQPTEVDV